MFLLILGLLIATVGFVLLRARKPGASSRGPALAIFGGLVLAVLGFLFSTVVVIQTGHVGVRRYFGKVQEGVLTEGLHLVNPLVDIIDFDTKTQNYTMSAVHDEGDKEGDDAIKVLTADGLEVTIDLTVLYRMSPEDAPRLLRETGVDYVNKIVRPISRTRIRDNAVYYDAIALYSTRRDEFQNRILTTITKDFQSRGLILEQLLVRNISLPESVKASIEEKIRAEQDAQKMQFVLQREKQEAERKRVEAQGIADYHKIISSGLSDRQLQYEAIKSQLALANSANSKVIIMNGSARGANVLINPN